jgi:hypothetical protein
LEGLDTTQLVDGCLCYVQSESSYYQLDKESGEVANGTTVVAALRGGNWIKWELQGVGEPITQTTWWIDRQNGDNANDGLTEATAIRDFAEFSRRVGENPLVTSTVTVNIAAGVGTANDTIIGGTGVDYSGGATNLPYIEAANSAMLVVRP